MPLTIPDDDALDVFALVTAGVKAKRLQRAYHYERDEVSLVAILTDQIDYGEALLTEIEHCCKLPSRSDMKKILKDITNGSDIPPTEPRD